MLFILRKEALSFNKLHRRFEYFSNRNRFDVFITISGEQAEYVRS